MLCGRICRLVMLLLTVGVNFVDGGRTNYNNEEHNLLCDVLKAAVGLWEKRENRNGALGRALAQTIFGVSDGVRDPTNLNFPGVYKSPDYRLDWCGGCDDQTYQYPGKSISHDLLCLCTVGGDGMPFNIGGKTLCGREADDLGCKGCRQASSNPGGGRGPGWEGENTGKDQLEKTWDKIIVPCLKSGTKRNLKAALEKFTLHLNGTNQLGGPGSNCGGSTTDDLCVNYTNCGGATGYPMWWEELEKAFAREEAAALSLEGSASGPAVGRSGAGTSAEFARRPNTGKGHDRETADRDSATKDSPNNDPHSPIASESSEHSRGTSNGEGGNSAFLRLLGTFKLSQLNWFLFSGLL